MSKKLPKGFIGEGKGCSVNIDCLVSYEYIDNKLIATDKFGIKHYVSDSQIEKLEGRL